MPYIILALLVLIVAVFLFQFGDPVLYCMLMGVAAIYAVGKLIELLRKKYSKKA